MGILDTIKQKLSELKTKAQGFFGIEPKKSIKFEATPEQVKTLTANKGSQPREDQLTSFLLESTLRPAARFQARTKLGGMETFNPTTRAEQFLYGPEPFRGFKGAGQTVSQTLGIDVTNSGALAAIGLAGGIIEAIPGTPGKKKVAKEVAEQVGENLLKKEVKETFQPTITKLLNVSPETQKVVNNSIDTIRPTLEKVRGATITNEEVVEAAKSASVLKGAVSREATLKSEAALLRTRQHLAALAEGKTVTKDFVETLKTVSTEATQRGRELQALGIVADPSLGSTKSKIIKELLKIGVDVDEIVKRAEGVDFNNLEQVTKFYREFVKPKLPELIDEYRYINLLSSPRTHIVNAFSNLLQAGVVRPTTKGVHAVFDTFSSALTGNAREAYLKEIPTYYKGAFSSLPDAFGKAMKALRGESIIARPDIKSIPTGKFGPLSIVPRALEASDVFFRTVIESAEKASLLSRGFDEVKATTKAAEVAEEMVFRKALDPKNKTGQGVLLSSIDKMTSAVYRFRDVPLMKWFIPFVQTPMNILKQGIEYSPLGLATLPGGVAKQEKLAKAFIGSMVMGGAATLAFQGNATWGVPTNKDEREAFYASGRQPYSVRIGNRWYNYSKLGPLAYPIAMASAIQYYTNENPKAVTESQLKKLTNVVAGIGEFFGDQSYLEGLGNIVDIARGDQTGLTRTFSNIPSQLIPLSSLQRWVANIVDPIYRKADKGLSVDAILDNLKKGIPFLSSTLDPEVGPDGEPRKREAQIIQSFSPVQFSTENAEGEELLKTSQEASRLRAKSGEISEDRKQQATELYEMMKSLPKEEAKAQFGELAASDKKLAELVSNISKQEKSNLSAKEKIILKLGVENGDRAEMIVRELDKIQSREEKKRYYQELIDKKIITKAVNEQVISLIDL